MRRVTSVISIIFLILSAIFLPIVNAGECDYGVLDAWYSLDDVNWENATVHDAQLKRGEPFYVKATVRTKIEPTWLTLKIWETGESNAGESSFEIINGPCDIYEVMDIGEISERNTSINYTWKMRVKTDTDWAGGNSPLNIRVQFDEKVYEEWYSDEIYFTIVNVNILDELWEGYTEDNGNSSGNNDTNDTPGFELLFALIAIAVFLTWKRKKE